MRLALSILALAAACGPVWSQTPAPTSPESTSAAPTSAAVQATGDWRAVSPENLLVIDTTKGRILVELAPELAPLHVERMRLLTRAGFFDNIAWHRVIDWFMAQTGDPLGTGEGQSAHPDLTAEFTFRRGPETPFTAVAAPTGSVVGFVNAVPVQTQPNASMALTADKKVHAWGVYCPGVAGMARGDANDSANSQFFLMRQAYPSLDKRYTVWGVVVSGLDVVRAMKVGEGDGGMVVDPDRMTRVRIAADIPEAERPIARVLATGSQRFRDLAEAARTARGADFSICDVVLPTEVSGGAAATAPVQPSA